MRNGKIYLAPNDSFEKFYLAVKGLTCKTKYDPLSGLGMQIALLFVIRKWVRVGNVWRHNSDKDEPRQILGVISSHKCQLYQLNVGNFGFSYNQIANIKLATSHLVANPLQVDCAKEVREPTKEKPMCHGEIERPHFFLAIRCLYLAVTCERYTAMCQRMEKDYEIWLDARFLKCLVFRPLTRLFGDSNDRLPKKLISWSFECFKVG